MTKPNGGEAFPELEEGRFRESGLSGVYEMHFVNAGGMSLRDYFAGQALAGLNTLPTSINRAWQTEVDSRGGIAALRARCAYADADAMIAERDK